jgi:DNA-binding protein HU-beta
MTKADLVKAVANRTGLDRVVIQTVFDEIMEAIKSALAKKESVFLRGFGTFSVKHRAEKPANNISRRCRVVVPAHDVPHFKPCPEFKNRVE